MSGLPAAVPLLRSYDAARMAGEALALREAQWQVQQEYYGPDGFFGAREIDWRVLPLHSPGGDQARTDSGGAGLVEYASTPFLREAPYFAEILAEMPAPLRSVRLIALGPGVEVREHRDEKCGYPWGVMRLHIPVITNQGAKVIIDQQDMHWQAGQLWFGDFSRPHYVRNTGDEPRVHLVIDVQVTLELLTLFPREYLDELPWANVLIARKPLPLRPADLAGLRCKVPIPAEFPQWSEDEDEYQAGPDVDGAIEVLDGRLILVVAGEPAFGLVHVGLGEFRLEGWTEERTLHLDLSDPDPTVRFRVRTGHKLTEWIRSAAATNDPAGD